MDALLHQQLQDILYSYENPDCDTMMVFRHWQEMPPCRVLEVGANEEYSACALAKHGYEVVGVDLRDQAIPEGRKSDAYTRIKADFVLWAREQPAESFDVCFSTSAIEHFGLPVYGQQERIDNYDQQTMTEIKRLLKPGGTVAITVPYGCQFMDREDWRVYNNAEFNARYVQDFDTVKRLYFKSGACHCPDNGWDQVAAADADAYSGSPPHVTVFALLRKRG